jgi:two-component SAPR family response regulator
MLERRLAGYRVLVVEDEFFLAADLEDALDRSGAEIIGPLSDLDAALAQVRSRVPDLATVDINLGGDMAYPLADELVREHVPFVFASSYEPEQIPARFQGIPHVVKPYAMEDLIGVLSALAAQRVGAHARPDKPAADLPARTPKLV